MRMNNLDASEITECRLNKHKKSILKLLLKYIYIFQKYYKGLFSALYLTELLDFQLYLILIKLSRNKLPSGHFYEYFQIRNSIHNF